MENLIDPLGSVNLGRAGTGRAVYFDSQRDPLLEAQKLNAAKDADAAAKQKAKAAKAQKLNEFDWSVAQGIEGSQKLLNERMDALYKQATDMSQKGYDFSDVNTPEGSKWLGDWLQLTRDAERNKMDYETYGALLKQYSTKVDEYDPRFEQDLNNWASQPIWSRGEPPAPDEYWDAQSFLTKQVDKFAAADTKAWAGLSDDNDFIEKGSVTEVSKDKIRDLAASSVEMEPKFRKRLESDYAAMTDQERQSKIKKAASEGFDNVYDYLAYDLIRGAAYKKVTADKSAISGRGGYGDRAPLDQAEYFVKQVRGYATGQAPTYQSLSEVVDVPGADRYLIDTKPNAYLLGKVLDKNRIKESLGGPGQLGTVVYDKKTGKSALISKDKWSVLQQEMNSSSPNSATLSAILKDFAEKEFVEPNALFSKDAMGIIEGSGELKLPYIVRYMKQEGLMDETGRVLFDREGRVKMEEEEVVAPATPQTTTRPTVQNWR